MIAAAVCVAVAAFALYLASPVAGVPWRPRPSPGLVGPFAPNDVLARTENVCGRLEGIPVALCASADGGVLIATRDPNVLWRRDAQGTLHRLSGLVGQPVGLAALPDGGAIAGILNVGLIWLDTDGGETKRLASVRQIPLRYPAAIAVAGDGTVAVADATQRFDRGFPDDFLDGRPNGRLIVFDPQGDVTAVVPDLYFPSGVAWTGPASLMIAETFRYRLRGVRLDAADGPAVVTLADNLPFMPYAIEPIGNRRFAIPGSPRSATSDGLQAAPRFFKKLIAVLPARIMSSASTAPKNRYGFIGIFDADGHAQCALHDPAGTVFGISRALAADGFLYLGSFYETTLRRLPLGAIPWNPG